MKDIQLVINPTEVKSINYNNAFNKKNGEKVELQVKSEIAVKLNPANPVNAVVLVKLTVSEAEDSISMVVETVTPVSVSSFVDNLDDYIKSNFMPPILMAVNEKVRTISSILGAPIKLPNPSFGVRNEKHTDDYNGLLQ